jgi:hypothetical protein
MTSPVVGNCLVGCSIFAWKNPASPACIVAFLPACLLTPLHFPFLLGEPAVRFAQTIAVRNIFHSSGTCRSCGERMEIMHSPVGPTGYSTLALLLQRNRRLTGDLVFPHADMADASRLCRSSRKEHGVVATVCALARALSQECIDRVS